MNAVRIKNHQEKCFIKWRTITYYSIFIGWGLYLLVRKMLPSSMHSLIQYKGFTKDNIGMIASSFSFSYGVSKLLMSFVSDHVSPRKVFTTGLMLTGICCALFPVASGVTMACTVWFIAGVVQGCGWAPCVILLKAWYSPSQIGTWWSVLSSAGNIAAGLSPLFILYITEMFDWITSYYLIGCVAFILSCIMIYTIKDSPEEVGVGRVVLQTSSKTSEADSSEGGQWYNVFLITDLWIVAFMYMAVNAVKDGVLAWVQLFLIEVGKKPEAVAAASVGMVQIGGMTGNLVIGYVSDLVLLKKASKCPRAPLLLGLSMCLVAVVHTFRTSVVEGIPELWLSVVTFSVGFLFDGAIAIVGLCAMEVVPHHMAGSAHGLACAVAQVGNILAGWPFAYMMGHYSWNMAYWAVELFSVSMVIASLYLVFSKVPKVKKQHSD